MSYARIISVVAFCAFLAGCNSSSDKLAKSAAISCVDFVSQSESVATARERISKEGFKEVAADDPSISSNLQKRVAGIIGWSHVAGDDSRLGYLMVAESSDGPVVTILGDLDRDGHSNFRGGGDFCFVMMNGTTATHHNLRNSILDYVQSQDLIDADSFDRQAQYPKEVLSFALKATPASGALLPSSQMYRAELAWEKKEALTLFSIVQPLPPS